MSEDVGKVRDEMATLRREVRSSVAATESARKVVASVEERFGDGGPLLEEIDNSLQQMLTACLEQVRKDVVEETVKHAQLAVNAHLQGVSSHCNPKAAPALRKDAGCSD